MGQQALDIKLMERALAQAARGLDEGAMPIGAVLTCEGDVLAEAHWRGISEGMLSHPEHVVMMQADSRMAPGQRQRSTLYTTLEPCLMCMGTAMSFGVGRIVYALAAPADGAADVATQWMPKHGHPTSNVPYALPLIEGGVEHAAARSLIEEWLRSGATGAEAEFAQRTLADLGPATPAP